MNRRPTPRYRSCPVCGSQTELRWLYDNAQGNQVFACARCEVVVLDAAEAVRVVSDPHYVSAEMERLYHTSHARLADTARHYLATVEACAGGLRGRRLLDVGAGLGVFLDAAREAGAETAGLDIRTSATRFLAERGHTAHTRLLPELAAAEPGRYDVVTAWNVIEHDDDPRRFVEAAFALLRPGGCLVLETPHNFHALKRLAYGLFRVLPPERRPVVPNLHTLGGHQHGFSPRSTVALLDAVGFVGTGSGSVPYDGLTNLRKLMTRAGPWPRRLVTAAAVTGGLGALRLAGIRNRFTAWGVRPEG